jgi:hypothetical protein
MSYRPLNEGDVEEIPVIFVTDIPMRQPSHLPAIHSDGVLRKPCDDDSLRIALEPGGKTGSGEIFLKNLNAPWGFIPVTMASPKSDTSSKREYITIVLSAGAVRGDGHCPLRYPFV